MNKKVIALAVAGALASPLAAQAQTANVTMYGTFRLAMESTDIKDVGRTNHIDTWSSRWGIRGTESLGGGLSGLFHLELGVNIDNPGGATVESTAPGTNASVRFQPLTIRESWVGLNGNFGTIKIGAGLTPWDDVMGLTHLLLANSFDGVTLLGAGGSTNIVRGGTFNNIGSFGPAATSQTGGQSCNNAVGYDARYGSSLRYDSPVFSGLQFATQYAFLGENATGYKCKGWDSKVQYMNGPIEAGIAYAKHIDFQTYEGDAWVLHGAYDFGVAKVLASFHRMKWEGNNGSVGESKVNFFNVGAQIPLGPGVISVQYSKRNKGANITATTISDVDNGGGKAYTASYRYNFSKRTFAWVHGSQVRADDAARVEGGPLGGKANTVGFGMGHNF
jgi:predicted porin